MAITFVGDSTFQTAAAASSWALPKPSGVLAGDVMIATVASSAVATDIIIPPAGWTLLQRQTTATSITMATYVRVAANAAIAADGTGVVSATSASAQAERIANETTAPSGEAFSAPTTKATGIQLPDIPAGSCVGVWIRRTATNSAAIDSDGAVVRLEGDSQQ